MDRIWAPWRMEYLTDMRKEEKSGVCVFCYYRDSKSDPKDLILYRGKQSYLVLNKYPYTNGHLLVVPNQHSGALKDLNSSAYQEIFSLSVWGMEALRKTMNAAGFNCGMNIGKAAGAGIPDHFHFHVVPRWIGDHNFFPVIADTRPISEYLEKTYERLLPEFSKKEGM